MTSLGIGQRGLVEGDIMEEEVSQGSGAGCYSKLSLDMIYCGIFRNMTSFRSDSSPYSDPLRHLNYDLLLFSVKIEMALAHLCVCVQLRQAAW